LVGRVFRKIGNPIFNDGCYNFRVALGIENRTKTRLKKAGKNVSHFLKRNNPSRKPERKKNFESSSEIFLNQFSKSHLSALIRK
jgi:hypothetical protein